jgi:predicted AlkP superfamily phosphohydrolase/phosphomutase
MTPRNHPVVLFGIDGATYSILDPLMEAGTLPHLSRLKQEGSFGILQSNIHPLTPSAWVSMVTGLNPGRHGVYDFRRRKAGSYDWELVNHRSWGGEPLWSILGAQGKKVGVFHVPMTYPPRSVNGFMVSGMGTPPHNQNFVYPSTLAAKFHKRFPAYEVDPGIIINDPNEYLVRCLQSTDQHISAARFFWQEYPDLDFFMPVFIQTDRVQHPFWRFVDPCMPDYHAPSASAIREAIISIYQRIDAFLGELWTWTADHQGYLVVASDHGFGPLLKDVYINTWLIDHGYLTLKSDQVSHTEGRFFDQVDWDKTRAYSFGFFGNINLNLYGREPRGVVLPGREAETLKHEIVTRLSQVTDPDTGEAVVSAIYRKEELYSGLYIDQAPDLLLRMKDYAYMTRDGFDFNNSKLMGPPMEHNRQALPHSGNHRLEGIILMAGEGVRHGLEIQRALITDVAPTVLYMAGCPVPTGHDGQVLLSAFDETFIANQPPVFSPSTISQDSSFKSVKVQLLEKDVKNSLLDEEVRKLQRAVVEQGQTIRSLEEIIQAFQQGKIMRFLAWLQRTKEKLFS